MRLIIAAGGTGGHLFPGIAVAEAVKRLDPAAEILFVGSDRGLEGKILSEHGFSHEVLSAGKLKGVGWIDRMKTLMTLPVAGLQARKILKRFAPDAVLGVGGYSSGPMLLAASVSRISTAFLEPNAIPGFTNRRLGPFVDRIFVGFPEAARFFSRKKVLMTGSPVRSGLPREKRRREIFTVLILGGSQGASSLNRAVTESLSPVKRTGRPVRIFHQTGERDFQRVKEAYEKSGISHEVFPFSHEMGRLYAEADLVICRAGASTVAELIETGSPAVLVPYPFAADDHQRWNALSIVEAGGGELLRDDALDGDVVTRRVLHYEKRREELAKMREALIALRRPPAAEVIAKEMMCVSHA